ncbi:hypothetical protein LIPSTDRAFT_114257, partial [Lipomyces starkeyi NRRL Y-11557]
MASLPAGACCMEAYAHHGEPAVATDKAIVYLTDIFGMPFTNHELIADNFAQQGFLTVVPNLFYDDHRHQAEHTEPIIEKTFEFVKKEFPVITKYFSVGYCYGAKYVVRLLDEGKLNAGYIAHPSFVTEEELRTIKGPLSIAAAETDSIFPEEKRHQSETILK